MKKIKEIIIKNFQSHKYTCIPPINDLTCIVGEGDVGKSSLLRALSFLFYGEPWQKDFIRHGAKEVEISIVYEDETKITRIKGEKVNKFLLEDGDNKLEFSNFGTGIPAEIQIVFGITPAIFDRDITFDLNISSQIQSTFLLAAAGINNIRAKVLGKLSGLDRIDRALRDLNRDKRNLNIEKLKKEKDIELYQQELMQYEGLDEYKQHLDKVHQQLQQLELQQKQVEKLERIVVRINNWKDKFSHLCLVEQQLHKLDLEKCNQVIQLDNRYQQVQSVWTHLVDVEEKFLNIKREHQTTQEHYKELLQQYKQYLKDNKTCPLCSSTLTDDSLTSIIDKIK